jgi:hypothetical protein
MPLNHSSDPPRTLVERLEQLNDSLRTLGDRLKDAISSTIGDTVSEAVRDAVRGLLGSSPQAGFREQPRYQSFEDDWCDHEDHLWPHEPRRAFRHERELLPQPIVAGNPWGLAVTTMVQAGLSWMRRQSARFPVLTTLVTILSVGATALLAGPVLGTGAGVIATIAGLVLTADSVASTVGELATISD